MLVFLFAFGWAVALCWFLFAFKSGSCYVAQASLEFATKPRLHSTRGLPASDSYELGLQACAQFLSLISKPLIHEIGEKNLDKKLHNGPWDSLENNNLDLFLPY